MFIQHTVRDWPGLEHLPEYQSLQRLDPYHDRLGEWCRGRFNSKEAFELLRQLFAYDPDSRLTAKEALQHRWFQEEPKPTLKYVAYALKLPLNTHMYDQCVRLAWADSKLSPAENNAR